jgi:hypothetical protein
MRSSAWHVRRQTNLPFCLRFLDQQGADFLVELFALSSEAVRRTLICRPLNERECGDAFRRRASDFRRLGVRVYEYALPSVLPSGGETFHAKVVLADARSFYVGSSNFMGSALSVARLVAAY